MWHQHSGDAAANRGGWGQAFRADRGWQGVLNAGDGSRWYAVAAVKRGGTLTLYLDGTTVGSCAVPELLTTQARDCALGGNPHFKGGEFLAAQFADFRFYERALANEEIQGLAALK